MTNYYKCNKHAFILAKKWLKEYSFKIILYLEFLVQIISFMTDLNKTVKKNKIHLYKYEIDTTCKHYPFLSLNSKKNSNTSFNYCNFSIKDLK
jgi:hypothetical protein